MNEKLPVANIV